MAMVSADKLEEKYYNMLSETGRTAETWLVKAAVLALRDAEWTFEQLQGKLAWRQEDLERVATEMGERGIEAHVDLNQNWAELGRLAAQFESARDAAARMLQILEDAGIEIS